MMKPETLNPPLPVPTVCANCGLQEHHLLLNTRQRTNIRRLCITCVLRAHLQAFCPTCFAFYGDSPPSGPEFVICTKCYSISHSRCATATMGPFLCPLCINPNSPIFVPKKAKDGRREIDPKAASVLFAAARIAASTMEKAAEVARTLAEDRAREAAVTRKIAKRALEEVADLEMRERLKKKEISITEASGSGTGTASVIDRNQKTGNLSNDANSFTMKNPVMPQELNRSINQMSVDGPNEVSVRLNAVGLKEKERLPAFRGPIAAPSGPKPNGALILSQNVGGSMNNSTGVRPNNGLYSVPPAVNNSTGMKPNIGSFSVRSMNNSTGLRPPAVNVGGSMNNSTGVRPNNGSYSVSPAITVGGSTNNSTGVRPNNNASYSVSPAVNVGGSMNNSTGVRPNNGSYSVPPAANVGGSMNNSTGVRPNNGLYSVPPAIDRQQQQQQHMVNSRVKEDDTFPKQ